jgi:hypothetical protein
MAPKASSSRSGQPQHGLSRLRQVLRRPPTDAVAAEEMLRSVHTTLTLQHIITMAAPPNTNAVLCPHVAVALQCAGWLVVSLRAAGAQRTIIWATLAQCIGYSHAALGLMKPVPADVLLAVLQPTQGGCVPGGCTGLAKRPIAHGETQRPPCILAQAWSGAWSVWPHTLGQYSSLLECFGKLPATTAELAASCCPCARQSPSARVCAADCKAPRSVPCTDHLSISDRSVHPSPSLSAPHPTPRADHMGAAPGPGAAQ